MHLSRALRFFSGFLFVALAGTLQAQPTVANVRASQSAGTKQVVILYDLA